MKFLFALLTGLIVSTCVSADAPPQWETFAVKSSNGLCSAKIEISDKNADDTPSKWQYKLVVSKELTGTDGVTTPKILWDSNYRHNGYSGGQVSNDCEYFVFVDYWYYHDTALVEIYHHSDYRIVTGKQLGINQAPLQKTVSHQLWLKSGFSFIYKNGEADEVAIDTVQGVKRIKL